MLAACFLLVSYVTYSSTQVGFVVDKVAPGQVFSEYFGFPCHSFH
jgi:hypothetical protein